MKKRGNPRTDLETLVRELLPRARTSLEEQGSFIPFGGALQKNGEIKAIAPEEREDAPLDERVIEWIDAELRRGAGAGQFSATAAVANVAVRRSDGGTRDAVHVKLDHARGASLELFFPYRIKRPGIATFGRAFSREGEGRIFD
jgi:hypothetical protein